MADTFIDQARQSASNVLPFPQTAKALRKYRSGMDAAGLLTLLLLDREGESAPANVRRIDNLDETAPPPRSVERMLLLLIFSALPAKKRETIKRLARCAAYGQDADAVAVELHNLLKWHP